MELSADKEWMKESNRCGDRYIEGAKKFLQFANTNLPSKDLILYPCKKCRYGKLRSPDDVMYDLVKEGIDQSYTVWYFHGENRDSPAFGIQQRAQEVQIDNNPSEHPRMEDLVDDAYEMHVRKGSCVQSDVGSTDVSDQPRGTTVREDALVTEDKDYIQLKREAKQPLYPNCSDGHTTLYAMVGLNNLKCRFGWSGTSLTELLVFLKELLPPGDTLPSSYPDMKKTMKGLRLKYKSINACPNDCILYWKEHVDNDICPKCHEHRYENNKKKEACIHPTKKRKESKVPQKILRYFPLGPRLKRLYTVPWIANEMTWHARAQLGDDLMRHPIDSTVWKAANHTYKEFVKENRNVRLGMSTDGFNPFANMSTVHSCWPVIVVPYNLPPSLCMKREFSMLTLLILGPTAPSGDIDVFLQPLVEELKMLWDEGVLAFDSFRRTNFQLKAMLLWAIHDFPAYGTLSGSNVYGYKGSPSCADETEAMHLPHTKKMCYHGHRRFLPRDHKFRAYKNNFLFGIEERSAPRRLSGVETERRAAAMKYIPGKRPKDKTVARKRKKRDDNEEQPKSAWSRRSIFFDLPYWKEHSVRHVIDVMHAEKNITEHLVHTCLNAKGKMKDSLEARRDCKEMGIKRSLWLTENPHTSKEEKPSGAFELTRDERQTFLCTLKVLRVPSKFSSNLRSRVSEEKGELKQCKSHDWHVIMQHLLPLLFRNAFSKHKDLRKAIVQISLCFNLLCAKVISKVYIMAARRTLVEATCVLEKYFPLFGRGKEIYSELSFGYFLISECHHLCGQSYASMLYLKLPSGFQIILRGKCVEHHQIEDDMMIKQRVEYKPQVRDTDSVVKDPNVGAVISIGFVKDARDHVDVQGFIVYHKNRLIKPFWRVWTAARSKGRGVIGVLEANFV